METSSGSIEDRRESAAAKVGRDGRPRPPLSRRGSAAGARSVVRALLVGGSVYALAAPAAVAQPGALFPEPFRIEHQLVQDDGDGNRFTGEPVVDTYGGSWIVSQRPDGSRLVVDLARRELTEVRVDQGTYWTSSFDRFAELQLRLRAAQGLARRGGDPTRSGAAERRTAGASAPSRPAPEGAAHPESAAGSELVVVEVPLGAAEPLASASGARAAAAAATVGGAGLRRVRVVAAGGLGTVGGAVEVWLDPALRVGPGALAALASLDDVLAGPSSTPATAVSRPGRFVAAARAHGGGAVVVKTSRPAGLTAEGEPIGAVEDVATRVERLDRFPAELVEVPEGLRRVPHPLEATVRFLEEEQERNAVMSGAASPTEQ